MIRQYLFALFYSLSSAFVTSIFQSILATLVVDQSGQSVSAIVGNAIRQPVGLFVAVAVIVSICFPIARYVLSKSEWKSDNKFLAWGLCMGFSVVLWPILTLNVIGGLCGADELGPFLLCVGNTVVLAPVIATGTVYLLSFAASK